MTTMSRKRPRYVNVKLGVAGLPNTVTSAKGDQQKWQKCSKHSLWHS